jgi:hypothetical protein
MLRAFINFNLQSLEFTMSKWISGNELIEKFGLKDFEFFSEYVSKGLQPYDKRGSQLSPFDILIIVENMVKKENDSTKFEVPSVNKQDWANIKLPESYLASNMVLNHIKDALYRFDDLNKFGKNISGSNPNLTIPKKYWTVPEKSKDRKIRHDQRCRLLCRDVAKQFWDEDPTITIADMIKKKEIIEVSKKSDGTLYQEDTVRNWIKDLCPDRSPGRRYKKAEK